MAPAKTFASVRVLGDLTVEGSISPAQNGVVTHPFNDASGWTTVDGTGNADITSGVLRLSHNIGADAYRLGVLNYNGASAFRALGMRGDFDVCVRIASMSAENASYALLEIADASSAGERYSIFAQQNGAVSIVKNTDNTTHYSIAGVFPGFTGQEWLRLSVRAGLVTGFTGIGVAGARPALWSPLWNAIGTAVVQPVAWSHVSCSVQVVGIGATSTTDFDDFTTVDLGNGL